MAQAALRSPEPDRYRNDVAAGEILRARLHYQQSLSDVEQNLRIKAELIDAIENGHIDRLPGRTYAIGFVRSYAEYLGLDERKIVQLFKHQTLKNKPVPVLHFPVAAPERRIPSRFSLWMSGALVLLVVLMGALMTRQDRRMVDEIPALPARAEQPAPAQTAAPLEPEVVSPVADKDRKGIILNVKEGSWVEIRDQTGRALVSRMLKPGDQYFVPERPDLTMSLGNAAGVEVVVDGTRLPPLGAKGDILKNVVLDNAALKATAVQAAKNRSAATAQP